MMARFSCFLVLLMTSGCVSYWQGKDMRADVDALTARVDQLGDAQHESRKRLDKEVADLKLLVDEVNQSLEKAISNLRTNSADSGMDISDLQQQIGTIRGELATFQHRLEQKQNEERESSSLPVAESIDPNAPQLPVDAAELYRYGYEQKSAGDCGEAERAFSKLIRDFPQYERAPNSLALAAECQFISKDYRTSLRTLKELVESYSKSNKVDDAMVLMHDNFLALGQCKKALVFLENMLDEYPKSNRIKEARKKLKSTRKSCR